MSEPPTRPSSGWDRFIGWFLTNRLVVFVLAAMLEEKPGSSDHEDPRFKIGRPRQLYTGAAMRDYVDVEDR